MTTSIMKILKLKPNIIEEVIAVLKSGGIVVFPSDTVYGLLCDATSEKAVKKLISFKERPAGRAISVFVSDLEMMKKYAVITNNQLSIIKELLPGPFTVIFKSRHKVAKLLESEKGTLGLRIPKYEFINGLVKKFGKPITATSANLSGRSSVYDVTSLLKTLSNRKKDLIDLIIDAGKLPRNKPSTVLDLTESEIKTLRTGDMKFTSTKIYKSQSEKETKEIARKIFREQLIQYSSRERSESRSSRQARTIKPLIFILKGDLGAGKTVFVKGIGEELDIKDIISPTFVIYYEYDISMYRYIEKLIHIDLYNLEDPREFEYLGLNKYLKPGNIFCIEWGEKSEPIIDRLKEKGQLIYVNIRYVSQDKREIVINY